MKKSQLIDKIAAGADISKAAAGRALDAIIASVTESLKEGDDVALVGFGTFAVKERAARTGRNPQTGEEIAIAASTSVGFKAAAQLKRAVNGHEEALARLRSERQSFDRPALQRGLMVVGIAVGALTLLFILLSVVFSR